MDVFEMKMTVEVRPYNCMTFRSLPEPEIREAAAKTAKPVLYRAPKVTAGTLSSPRKLGSIVPRQTAA